MNEALFIASPQAFDRLYNDIKNFVIRRLYWKTYILTFDISCTVSLTCYDPAV